MPLYVHYDPAEGGITCSDKQTVDYLKRQSGTLQRMYRYKMKSDRIDRFASAQMFVDQLADSLRAESTVIERKEEVPEIKEPEKKQENTVSDETGEVHIEL